MKITALVENQSNGKLAPKHGLSLYIETEHHKILFDLGPDDTLFKNAALQGIPLEQVDTVILSHGHIDHGGALQKFLEINDTAKIYVQKKAFDKHYTKVGFLKWNVGLTESLAEHKQVVLLDGDYRIDDELFLFTVASSGKYHSPWNNSLMAGQKKDDFSHEQNLLVFGVRPLLVLGCGHAGVVDILEKAASYHPEVCIGGFHLSHPVSKKMAPRTLLDNIASELKQYPIEFYTCHCTGMKVYEYLKKQLPNMHYFSCGEELEF